MKTPDHISIRFTKEDHTVIEDLNEVEVGDNAWVVFSRHYRRDHWFKVTKRYFDDITIEKVTDEQQ